VGRGLAGVIGCHCLEIAFGVKAVGRAGGRTGGRGNGVCKLS